MLTDDVLSLPGACLIEHQKASQVTDKGSTGFLPVTLPQGSNLREGRGRSGLFARFGDRGQVASASRNAA
jgi:hypothetical protein